MRAPVDAELGEGALVDQQREPLASGELVVGVLAVDPLLAAAEPRPLATLVQVLHKRAQWRPLDQRVGRGPLGRLFLSLRHGPLSAPPRAADRARGSPWRRRLGARARPPAPRRRSPRAPRSRTRR